MIRTLRAWQVFQVHLTPTQPGLGTFIRDVPKFPCELFGSEWSPGNALLLSRYVPRWKLPTPTAMRLRQVRWVRWAKIRNGDFVSGIAESAESLARLFPPCLRLLQESLLRQIYVHLQLRSFFGGLRGLKILRLLAKTVDLPKCRELLLRLCLGTPGFFRLLRYS